MTEQDTGKKSLHPRFNATVVKVALIAFLILLLEIPMARVTGLIEEREQRSIAVQQEIQGLWGGRQVIAGPVLVIPFLTRRKETEKLWDAEKKAYVQEVREIVEKHTLTKLPEKLSIKGGLFVQKRYRGIYETPVYQAQIAVSGVFGKPDFSNLNVLAQDIAWNRAQVRVGISDLRGVRKTVAINWNQLDYDMQPEVSAKKNCLSGLVAFPAISAEQVRHRFSVDFVLDGSEGLFFSPVGQTTDVFLTSAWPHPGFAGAFLPADREITEKGFTARWTILEVNRTFPRAVVDDAPDLPKYAFGVNIVSPVNVYLMATRAAKYATMFIALTFFALFVSELIARVSLHPIQYLLAGLAVVVFYALLLSLSEHIGFAVSYLASAIAVTALIGVYASGALGKKALALLVSGVLATLYAYWYVLLQMEDYALVFGCIGIFLLLASVMIGTRKTDWKAMDSLLKEKIKPRNNSSLP